VKQPPAGSARTTSNRSAWPCKHESTEGCFPRVGDPAAFGRTTGWAYQILPHIEQDNLFLITGVIMIYLPGGPSHMDMYGPKPDAPEVFRDEFNLPSTTTFPESAFAALPEDGEGH
jgi:hypothetical protein